jgi:hypothetical protein
MKLEFPKVPTEKSREFENENFSLGDMRVIMELLSSKIYSRPKYIIVQEVASNARDANREAGKADTPITIKLPNRFDDNFIISDSGIGISPARMSDVFLKYGNSTKRDSNEQVGGFGIGAKTPFTYTDTFTVVTVTLDDDGVNRRRTYIAHKADNGFAKMSLVTTEETTDPTGTSISFAVMKDDFYDFEHATRSVCQYWSPRPKIEGKNGWQWPEETVAHQGKGWTLCNGGNGAKVLIDSIPYTLRLDSIFKDRYSNDAYTLLSGSNSVRMYFETGEIDVSATREDLDYKDRTIKAVKDRANEILTVLRDKVNKTIASSTSLWDATISWRKLSGQYSHLLVKPKWQGLDLLPNSMKLGVSIDATKITGSKPTDKWINPSNHVKITVFEWDSYTKTIQSQKSGWRGKSVNRTISVQENTLIMLDDSGKSRPNKLRLQTLFETRSCNEIAVVTFKTTLAEAVANYVLKWEHIPHEVLSTIPKAKNAANASGKTYTVNAVKKLTNGSRSYVWQ